MEEESIEPPIVLALRLSFLSGVLQACGWKDISRDSVPPTTLEMISTWESL
jgi:hypothetical protein